MCVTARRVDLFGLGVLVGLTNDTKRITQLFVFYPFTATLVEKNYKITLCKMQ